MLSEKLSFTTVSSAFGLAVELSVEKPSCGVAFKMDVSKNNVITITSFICCDFGRELQKTCVRISDLCEQELP